MSELVLTERVGRVAVVSYNRPEKHNAFNNELTAQHRAAMEWALDDPDTTVIVLRGEGKSFSSGRDTNELGGRPNGESNFAWVRESQELRFRLMTSTKIAIAAMKGYVLGGALEQCLACDIRIASPDAQMSLPEINYGILPDTGGTQVLTTMIGPGRAKELVLTGRRFSADEALAWGVVNKIVPEEDLDKEVMAMATTISEKAPLALAMGKQLVDQVWADEVHRGLRSEVITQAVLFASADYQEARAARKEGRPPMFVGK
jgi:enoyl-CoA hydratase